MSMQRKEIDALIIGQGLAGSLLAWTLIQKGQSAFILDDDHRSSSSMVAAGIINPVAGKRFKPIENFSSLFDTAQNLYQDLEDFFSVQFHRKLPQFRSFQNEEEQVFWKKRISEKESQNFFTPEVSSHPKLYPQKLGGTQIESTFQVSVPTLLQKIRKYLQSKQAYQKASLDYSEIKISSEHILWKNIQAKRVVFCQGYQNINNPWFRDIGLNPAKGEILHIQSKTSTDMLHWGHWWLPDFHRPNHYRLGSNYAWENLHLLPSQDVYEQLLSSLDQNLKLDSYQVIQQETGIRPASKDRKPLIGSHLDHKNLFCFNGFGSKGCILIPHYAQVLSDHLVQQKPLPAEAKLWR